MVADKATKRRVFIASSQADAAEVRKAAQHFDLDAVTLEQSAVPGTSWVDSLHRCVNDADMVVGVMGDRRKDTNVFFELGVASALNKPAVLFITADYPLDLVPPSGIPYLRMDLRNEEAVRFGLEQVLSLSPRDATHPAANGFKTHAIGEFADQLLVRLGQADPREFEEAIFEAIQASGASTIARGPQADTGVDFAVWSSDLEPTIANPLLIECKSQLRTQADVDRVIGQMSRALDAIHNGFGIVLYQEAGNVPTVAPKSLSVVFLSAQEFLSKLRHNGLAEIVRTLRNTPTHGL